MTTIPTGADQGGTPDIPVGWRGILDPGEHILWQGRPNTAFHMQLAKIPLALFGLFFAGFALFWMVMASQAGGVFWMFGLIHFSVGAGMVANSVLGGTFRRRTTWYTLTDRRAFVATDRLTKGRSLQSYPITADTRIDYQSGNPATITFAREERRGNKGRAYTVDIGFERIDDGDTVFALMRKVQRGAAAEAET